LEHHIQLLLVEEDQVHQLQEHLVQMALLLFFLLLLHPAAAEVPAAEVLHLHQVIQVDLVVEEMLLEILLEEMEHQDKDLPEVEEVTNQVLVMPVAVAAALVELEGTVFQL
jgi:hypothetical protein